MTTLFMKLKNWNRHYSYIARLGPYNAGERERIDAAGPRPLQRAGAGVQRGARGEHVVDQKDATAAHTGSPVRRYAERIEHIAPARLGRGHLALAFGRATLLQNERV